MAVVPPTFGEAFFSGQPEPGDDRDDDCDQRSFWGFPERVDRAIREDDRMTLVELLCGAVYFCNLEAVESVTRLHDFGQYVSDEDFCDLMVQTVYQMEAANDPSGPSIRRLMVSHFGGRIDFDVGGPAVDVKRIRKRKRSCSP